jgi:hypothetical protein
VGAVNNRNIFLKLFRCLGGNFKPLLLRSGGFKIETAVVAVSELKRHVTVSEAKQSQIYSSYALYHPPTNGSFRSLVTVTT